jgi:transcriptional regulator with XRE-family HTH domain
LDFATKLKLMRTLRNVNQIELAERTGIGTNFLSALETGKIMPGPEWEAKLLEALGYSNDMEPMLAHLAGNGQPA